MKQLLSFLLIINIYTCVYASDGVKEQDDVPFDPTETIMHHIADSHSWHVLSWNSGDHETDIEIPLPIILIHKGKLHTFLYSKFDHETHIAKSKGAYFIYDHGAIYETDKLGTLHKSEDGHIENAKPFDLSLTRNVFSMWLSVIIILAVFLFIAKKYKGQPAKPTGIQSIFEPIVLFIRDDIARDQLGDKASKFTPYLLTVFFFIWINNLIGLVPFFPGGSNFTGNISATMVLATITFLLTNIYGSKSYWKHTLTAPGVPIFVKIILIPIEIIGLFTKPFALTIRLLANITAGHIIILSLVSLIFILKSIYISPVSILLSIVMYILEMLVAILQAYIFTLLSAMFIGMATTEEEH